LFHFEIASILLLNPIDANLKDASSSYQDIARCLIVPVGQVPGLRLMLEAGTPGAVGPDLHWGFFLPLTPSIGKQLNNQLSQWFQQVEPTDETFPIPGCKAVIAP
jgi:hypothetical protein